MKRFLVLLSILLFIIFFCSGCQQPVQKTYTQAEAQKIKDNANKLWNKGDIALVDSLYSLDCIYHNADLEDFKGAEKIKGFVKWVYTAYPDFAITLDKPMEFNDRTIVTYKATGTNTGPLGDNMPPTGKKIAFNGVSISKIANGKITEEWNYYNQTAIFHQLGFKYVPAAAAEMKK